MYTISKEFTFEAAHSLPDLPDDHKCHRLHGHSYRVRVELSVENLDEQGMVTDFANLRPFGDYLAASVDHRLLNDLIPWPPTSEHLARWLADVLAECLGEDVWRRVDIVGVGVSETPKTWAWWRP